MSKSPDHRTPAPILRHAATVMLLREAHEDVEVLVIRRHENLVFMGGMWVFPGGALCAADTSPQSLARIPPRSQERCAQFTDLQGKPLSRNECLGLSVAAYRETFEETGVMLATTADGNRLGDEVLARVQAQRPTIVSEPERFAGLLEEEQLKLDVDRLVYWAHWITPSQAHRRFDTRFFAATVPRGQAAMIDAVETVDHAWMSPAALVAAATDDAMPVSHPTLYNLMELDASLRRHGSLESMLAAEARREMAPVIPKLIHEPQFVMVLPWDPEYTNLPGETVPAHIQYPRRLLDLPSRIAGPMPAPRTGTS